LLHARYTEPSARDCVLRARYTAHGGAATWQRRLGTRTAQRSRREREGNHALRRVHRPRRRVHGQV